MSTFRNAQQQLLLVLAYHMARIAAHLALVQSETAKSLLVEGALSYCNRLHTYEWKSNKGFPPFLEPHLNWIISDSRLPNSHCTDRVESGGAQQGALDYWSSADQLLPVTSFDRCFNCAGVLKAGRLCLADYRSYPLNQPDIHEGIDINDCDLEK